VAAPLLVPVQLQALQVNPNVRAQGFQRWTMDYSALAAFRSPEPAPFAGLDQGWASNPANDGIHLQWTLPAALRRGAHDAATGATTYPLVPNRWLVVRLSGPAASILALRQAAEAWIVESDYLGPDGLSAYLDPAAPEPVPLRLGRVRPLAGWRETAARPPFLTALGPGNVAFASYQPYGAGVFSFHDRAADLGEGQAISYLVAGWYSDPAADVLAPQRQRAGLAARLAELGWTAHGPQSATTTLFHGAIRNLIYSRTAVGARPAATTLAVGNSSIDAMTALIRRQAERHADAAINPDLLEAFQYDLLRTLDDPDGPAELDSRIHEAWFGARSGGSVWQVVSIPAADAAQAALQEERTDEQDGAPAVAPPWLAGLNRAQSDYDAAARELEALQARLYELWWKRGRAKALPQRPAGLPDALFAEALDPARPDSLVSRVLAKTRQVAAARAAVPWGATQDGLTAAIAQYTRQHPLPPGTELRRADLPAFRVAADPVVVIAGARMDAFDDSLGEDADGLLPCRFADQTVSAMLIPAPPRPPATSVGGRPPQVLSGPPAPLRLTSAEVAPRLPALVLSGLDPAIGRLMTELFFLDPVNAAAIVELAYAVFRHLDYPVTPQQLLPAITGYMTAGQQLNGTLPAILPQVWAQPWAPLFLEWEVAYHPIPYSTYGPNWRFDGTNYTCIRATPDGGPIRLSGRSLLTPQPSFTVKARIDSYLATNPDADLGALESFVASVDGWDFLSQALSGFNAQLTLRDPASLRAPDARSVLAPPKETMASLIGRGPVAMPLADGAVAATAQPVAGSGFQALRAGQFEFTRVSVVDRFGQSADVVTPADAAGFTPVVGQGLATQGQFAGPAPTGRYVQLPPRLLQGARLDAQFLPAAANGAGPGPGQANSAAGSLAADPGAANPICAWIVPSPLDRALACYDANGVLLGELTGTARAGAGAGTRVSWLAAPGSPFSRIESLAPAHRVLADFLSQLVAHGPAGFAELLKTIDATLWTIDPPGSGDETYLAAMAGRPLALARASVRCELPGPALSDPTWQGTFDAQPPAEPAETFPVRLGDARLRGDGLVGYFVEPDYTRFCAAYVPPDLTAAWYVVPINQATFLQPGFGVSGVVNVTLLLDPRAPVHLVGDVLPVAELSLPQRFVTNALAAMSLAVRVGPVLTDVLEPAAAAPGAAPGPVLPTIVLPRPPQLQGTWQWAETETEDTGTATTATTVFEVSPADSAARFPGTAPMLRTGWLKLSGAFKPPPR
jgi:hypothetical protein